VVAEHSDPSLGDERQVLRSVVNDVDREPRRLLGRGSGGGEAAADVGERLAGLGGEVAVTDEVAVGVVRDLATRRRLDRGSRPRARCSTWPACPVTQVPLGLNRRGLPLGVQVAANHGRHHVTIAVAQFLERALADGYRLAEGTARVLGTALTR
jgi:hypothetical protein